MQGEAPEPTALDPTELDPVEPDLPGLSRERPDPKELMDRFMLARSEIAATTRRIREARARMREGRERGRMSRSHSEASFESAYVRLLARFESQPVIEQAKGILMAQGHCSADAAFEILRRASQRENVPVREIAARIVKRAATSER